MKEKVSYEFVEGTRGELPGWGTLYEVADKPNVERFRED
jgi:hypothetical protein